MGGWTGKSLPARVSSSQARAQAAVWLVFGMGGEGLNESVAPRVLGAEGDAPTEDVGAGQSDNATDHEVYAPGFQGVGLVLEPAAVAAVVGAGGGEGVPARGVDDDENGSKVVAQVADFRV